MSRNASTAESRVLMPPHIRCDLSHRQGVIWRLYPPPAKMCDTPPIMGGASARIKEIQAAIEREMKRVGIAAKPLSIAAKLGPTAVRDILKDDTQDVKLGTLARLASVLDVDLEVLLGAPRVPVVGFIGAGGTVIFEDMGVEETVLRPPAISGPLIALEVRGDSMLPKYEPGDVVYIQRNHDGILPEYVGEYCAVRLTSGETFLKRLAFGSGEGRWTLQSLNAADMTDVELEWATPVLFIMPRRARQVTS